MATRSKAIALEEPACPGCGGRLDRSAVRDGEMRASCPNESCRQRMTYRRVDGSWRILERCTLPAIAAGPP
jgi:hypothetical protein